MTEQERVAQVYVRHGLMPPWERVWRGGVDVTETDPPEAWGWPFSKYYAEGWRPLIWTHDGTVARMQ